ncbi:MAG: sulfotransferase family protein [Microcystaceae cyanobacterium]
MANSPIRNLKDTLIKNYFDYRINGVSSPTHIRFRKSPYKFIFILGHMRSASSLLVHILNSHPDIIGYGETHITYQSSQDFKTLLSNIHWRLREYKMNQVYVLDKLLHNNKLIDETLLQSENVYSIFLLREPISTIQSTLKLKQHWGEEKIVDYYTYRLKTLENYATSINNKSQSLVLTYNQLLNETQLVFAALQTFLKTKEPFSEEYKVLQTTGLKGVGDSSENIQSGKIIRKTEKDGANYQLSTEFADKVQFAYQHCLSHLAEQCMTIYPEA